MKCYHSKWAEYTGWDTKNDQYGQVAIKWIKNVFINTEN